MNMFQHVGSAQQHGGRVGHVLAHRLAEGVPCSRLKHCYLATEALTSYQPCPSDQPSGQVRQDVSVQVRHDHHVELLWLGSELHAAVVHDHLVKLNVGVLLAHLAAGTQE